MDTSEFVKHHAFPADGGWHDAYRLRDARAHAARVLARSALLLHKVGIVVVDACSTFGCWCEERRTIEILRRLSDRDLRDIGFERSEIPFIVHGLARDATPASPGRVERSEASSPAMS